MSIDEATVEKSEFGYLLLAKNYLIREVAVEKMATLWVPIFYLLSREHWTDTGSFCWTDGIGYRANW